MPGRGKGNSALNSTRSSATASRRRRRLAIIVSHPIQHFVPLYRALAATEDIDLRVFFASRIGSERYFDVQMQTEISWAMDMLGGYDHTFMPGAAAITGVSFWSINSPSLTQALDVYDPDAVMVYGYAQVNALRAMFWARRRGRGVIMISDAELRRRRLLSVRLAKEAIVRYLFRQIDAFLSVGDHNEDYYRYYGAAQEAIFRSPFTVDESALGAADANRSTIRANLRRSLNLSEDDIVALFVGKLTAGKRPGDIVAAVRSLHDRCESTPFVVFAGSGEMLDELKEQVAPIAERVHFAGFVNVDRLPDYYVAADILVHSSEVDNHPLVCSEAASVGLPMVLSDRLGVIGATDIARQGENAIVYPVGDVEALADALRTLMQDGALRAEMGEASRRIYRELDINCSVAGVRAALTYATWAAHR